MSATELERRVAELRSSRPWTEDDARMVLDACAQSGESVAVFARRMRLGEHRLFWWKKRLRCERREAPAFVPLVVREAPSRAREPGAVLTRGSVRIELRVLDAESAVWTAALLTALEDGRP